MDTMTASAQLRAENDRRRALREHAQRVELFQLRIEPAIRCKLELVMRCAPTILMDQRTPEALPEVTYKYPKSVLKSLSECDEIIRQIALQIWPDITFEA